MSIAPSLQNIETAINDAFDAVVAKGATMPTEKNMANLVEAINSVGIGDAVTPSEVAAGGSVAEYIENNLETHLAQAYQAIHNQGGIIPADKNFANLASAIESISFLYAVVTYKDANNVTKTYEINDINEIDQFAITTIPHPPYNIALNSLTLTSDQITEFEFKPLLGVKYPTRIKGWFLCRCINLTTLRGTEFLNTVNSGNLVLCDGCTSLNCPIYYPQDALGKGIGTFLNDCTSFNSPVIFHPGLTAFGEYFLSGCTSFNQPLNLPSTATQMERGFLYECTSFNQPLNLPPILVSIGDQFMDGCKAFARSLVFPDTLATVGDSLFVGMQNFIGPLVVPSGITFTPSSITLAVVVGHVHYPVYATGVTVTGAGAEEFKNIFPNNSTGTWRRNLK